MCVCVCVRNYLVTAGKEAGGEGGGGEERGLFFV